MAKIKTPVVRMSPFDVPLDLYQLAEDARTREQKTWKAFLTEGIRLMLSREAVEVQSQHGGAEEL